jgi:hypothetical protein
LEHGVKMPYRYTKPCCSITISLSSKNQHAIHINFL